MSDRQPDLGAGHSRRRNCLAALCAATLPLVYAAFAFACTPQAGMTISQSNGGRVAPAGATATVTGWAFLNGPVEVRWDSDAGPVLAVAGGPNFSVAVTIPDDSPSVHTIIAIARDPNGQVFRAADTIEISAPEPQPAGGEPAATAGTATGAAQTPGASRPASAARPTAARPTAARAPAARTSATGRQSPRSATATPVTRPVARVSAARPDRTPSSSRTSETGARETASTGAARVRRPAPAPRPSASPVRQQTPPSLISPLDPRLRDGGSDSRLGIGMALLGLGILLPLAGFAVAEARARRTQAGPRRGRS